jgi:hypothetical protein
MKPLSIVAYFDGRAGHEKQTRAILQALADMTDISVDSRQVQVSRGAYCKNWLSYLFAFLKTPNVKKFPNAADLIIGTGTYTHLPMLLEKKARAKIYREPVYLVTCMSPEQFLLDKFDLCCIPAHDKIGPRENIFVTLGPPTSVMLPQKHQDDRGLILVGGVDPKSHRWDSRQVIEQIKVIIQKSPDIVWTISSSPRTPEDTNIDLEKIAAAMEQVNFFRSEDTAKGWIEEQYSQNKTVWVTADSISMVYEALNGGCSVGILPVEWLKPDNKFERSLDMLRQKKMIVEYSDWQNGAGLPEPAAEPLNEARRCAREILRRWWPDHLQ